MTMTAQEFKKYVDVKQKEINEIMESVEVIKRDIYRESNKIFQEKGIEGFGKLYDYEWLGVAGLTIGDSDSSEYLFPYGLNEDYEGWVPSSQLG